MREEATKTPSCEYTSLYIYLSPNRAPPFHTKKDPKSLQATSRTPSRAHTEVNPPCSKPFQLGRSRCDPEEGHWPRPVTEVFGVQTEEPISMSLVFD